MTARNRIQLAAAFITQLHRLSSHSPHSWRRAESIGRDINLDGAALELVIRDTQKVGFIQRRADDEGRVILTAKGRAAASAS
jgi:DNA-binding MarR family transcriptional regulator